MKYLIIGAVAGGASTAARLRRLDEHAEIIIFEKGAYISYANCGLPYYIGDVIRDRNKLFVQTAASFSKRFNIDVRVNSRVTDIDTEAQTVEVFHEPSGETYEESYDKLVIAVGAEPIRPPLPGIDGEGIFTLRNVVDTDKIKHHISQANIKKAVIVGAGFIGLEMAENIHGLGIEVEIVEMGAQILAPVDFPIAAIIQQHIRKKGITLHLNTAVTSVSKNEVTLNNRDVINTDIVILNIGVKPDLQLAAAAGLETGRGIIVNEYLQTSDPNIYAVGDVIEFRNPVTGIPTITTLAGPANKQGRILANNLVYGNTQKYNGSINTAILKVFDMTVGTTGIASKHLKTAEIEHFVSTTHGMSHAGYYPGSRQMTIQIAFKPANGQLIGAQIAGYDGVDKRLDVFSSLIQQGKTIYDLIEFEQAYAPPYSSAKDPINIAGMVAENILLKRLQVVYWDDLENLDFYEDALIDVRTPDEFEMEHVKGAVNIPLDDLRGKLSTIPRDKDLYIYCEAGLRGYLAQRILLQNGFSRVWNMSGGFRTWKICSKESE
ncbi:FAD-dependent oxidoreductase [Chitinophaga sp.]|uniref:FAD-dependent oxidoreductase n=1 Tax=Chitinophaga sp. TaxID=1869181 RepID=UPI0031D2E5EC